MSHDLCWFMTFFIKAMHSSFKNILIAFCHIASLSCVGQTVQQIAQYPSPMRENVRKHERVSFDINNGTVMMLDSILPKTITLYIPKNFKKSAKVDLLVHFHGNADVVAYAAEQCKENTVAAIINLGSGSGVYAAPFKKDTLFKQLEEAVWTAITKHYHKIFQKGKIILSGFSAGYGAIRSIISNPQYFNHVNAVLLLDGLHTSYIPERKVLADGGLIDSNALQPFIDFAQAAALPSSDKRFLFTHSEIFPGTFASTTEAAGYLLAQLGIAAAPVLKWGPGGMQQISEASKGNCTVLGFAGNTAPDHVDHFHNLYYFLNKL